MTSSWPSRLVAGATAAVLLSGCTGEPVAGDIRVSVGLIASLSGAFQAVGEDTRDGFALYLESRGGRLGEHPVDVVELDEGDGGAEAVAAAIQLIQRNGMLAVTGFTNAETLTGVLPALRASRVPLVGSNGRPGLDDVGLVWTTSFLPDEPGHAIAGHLRDQVDGSVWTMAADSQAGRQDMSGFVSAFTAAGGRLANAGGAMFTGDITNFLPLLTAAKASGAKAVYASYAGSDAITFVQQYAQSDARELPLFAPGPLTEGRVLAAQGRAALGVQTALNYAPDLDNPTNRSFVDAWRAKYNRLPTAYAMASWDAALVLDKAIQAAGPDPTSSAVDAAIAGLGQIDSPRGVWQFSSRHAPVQKWYLRRVQTDGRTLNNSLIQDLDILGA